ncbi:MAG: hypothetical protein Tp138OMZ00d2C19078261_53 [Prokaryotic dsDNA virus sp.]|jgi:hypothetical protein|nr:MAG: hypothetical protein Tp138OMZ00d2C19078261_53 [Prokaryotic dsDNA virus sp.]
MAKTEVAEVEEKNTVVGSYDYGEDAGTGFEDTKSSDLSIPFINVLQSNSPEIEEEQIPGAKVGDMLNTVTGELIKADKGFCFIPCHKQEAWVEWVPRVRGGGFVGLHDPAGELVQGVIKANGGSRIPPKGSDGKRISFKNGPNELIETYYVYGLICNAEGTEVEGFAVISFSSTKIKPYRDWLTSMFIIKGKPPMFANRAVIKTVKQKNESGTFANFSISPLKETWAKSLINPSTERNLLEEARDFREMVISGVARADFQQQDAGGAEGGAGGGAGGGDTDEAPF